MRRIEFSPLTAIQELTRYQWAFTMDEKIWVSDGWKSIYLNANDVSGLTRKEAWEFVSGLAKQFKEMWRKGALPQITKEQ